MLIDFCLWLPQDTNPIFLFNKEMILCDRAPTIPKTTFSIENEMELKVEESLMMPAVFHTVASRTQLALVQANFYSDLMTNPCLPIFAWFYISMLIHTMLYQ